MTDTEPDDLEDYAAGGGTSSGCSSPPIVRIWCLSSPSAGYYLPNCQWRVPECFSLGCWRSKFSPCYLPQLHVLLVSVLWWKD